MTTATNWLEELPALDDSDLRLAHRRSRDILLRLGADRRLLTQLVGEIEHDPQRMTESEVHPDQPARDLPG